MARKMKKKRSGSEFINDRPSQADLEREERRQRRAEELRKKRDAQQADIMAAAQVPVNVRKAKTFSRRALIYFAIMLVIAIFVLFALSNVLSLKSQEKQAEEELALLKQEKAELEAQVSKMTGPEYIEQQARDWLKMIKPGELMFVFPNEDGSMPTEDTGNGDNSGSDASGAQDPSDSAGNTSSNDGRTTPKSSTDNNTPIDYGAGTAAGTSGTDGEDGGVTDFDTSLDPAVVTGSAIGDEEDNQGQQDWTE